MTPSFRPRRNAPLPVLRFVFVLFVAAVFAFVVGTRAVRPPVRPAHSSSGRVIPGMATNPAWMERPERVREEAPDRALALIGIGPGMRVADVGAGSGYMTIRIAALVGPGGRVYANEIQPAMLRLISARVRQERLTNVELVQGTADDARLPADTLDIVLLVDVYHELQHPQPMLQSIRRSLNDHGRLVLIEYRLEDPTVPIIDTHRMSVAGLRAEIEPEGFTLDQVIEELPLQHIVAFRKSTH